MIGHYTTRACCNQSFPGGSIKTFQSTPPWYRGTWTVSSSNQITIWDGHVSNQHDIRNVFSIGG